MAGRPVKSTGSPAATPAARGQARVPASEPAGTPPAKPAAERNSRRQPAPETNSRRTEPAPRRLPSLPAGVSRPVETGAGFLLGLLAWGWIGMPFLTGGAAGVKKLLAAKFLNKHPDGSWLP